MTQELLVLTLLALFASSMWVPYIIGVNMHPTEPEGDFLRPPDLRKFPQWVHRAHRAHLNLIESALPFAVVVLVAHQVGVSTTTTVAAAWVFLGLRLVHAVGMISGITQFPARSIIFTLSWIATLVIGISILAA